MNILISLSYYSPYISGLTIYAKNLAYGLSAKGYTVRVLTSQHEKNLPLKEKLNGVAVTRVPISFNVGKGPIMLQYVKPLIQEVKKADVVNCHLPQFESVLVALIAKCLRKRIILTYHTDLAVDKTISGMIVRYCLYSAQILTGMLADVIVTQSSDYAKQSKYLTFFKKKVKAIYPPIIFPQPKEKDVDTFRKRVSSNKKYLIGVVGRMAQEKGYEYLLEAVPILKKKLGDNFLILFAGPKNPIGEEAYIKKVTKLMEQYKESVNHVGILTEDELGAYYANLDVFVLPSVNVTEAFGMVQIEALSCGTPVVVSDLPGVRLPVQITGNGLISSVGDPKDLAEKITEVLKNKDKYQVDRQKIVDEFGLRTIINQYEKLFG